MNTVADLMERAGWTFLQSFVGVLVGVNVTTGTVDWREVLITVVRFVVIRYGVIAASRGGKLKTVLQTVALCAYILPVADVFVLHAAAVAVMAAAVAVTVWTGGEYLVHALKVWREGRAAPRS